MSVEVLSAEEHIYKRLSIYTGDISKLCINSLNMQKLIIEKIEYNLAHKKMLEEIIENASDYIFNYNVSSDFKVGISKLNKDDLSKTLNLFSSEEIQSLFNNKEESFYKLSFTNEINMKMKDSIKMKDRIINDCIPKYLLSVPNCSTKFNNDSKEELVKTSMIGMNGLGIKIIPYLCDAYRANVCIDNEIYILQHIGKTKHDILDSYENTNNKNTWTMEVIIKQSNFENLDNLLNLKLYETFLHSCILKRNINIYINDVLKYSSSQDKILFDNFINKLIPNNEFFKIDYRHTLKSDIQNLTGEMYIGVSQGVSNLITIVNGKFIYNSLPNKFKESIKSIVGIDNNDIFKHLSIVLILNNHRFEFAEQAKDRLCGSYILMSKEIQKYKETLNKLIIPIVKKRDIVGQHYVSGRNKGGTLIIVEGLSALTAVRGSMNNIKCDQSMYTYYAVTGKLKNYGRSEVNDKKFIYEELYNILQYSQLQDSNSKDKKEYKEYNKFKEILIFADADDDGTHIVCLLINLFKIKFPKLLNLIRLPILPSLICCNQFYIDNKDLDEHQNSQGKRCNKEVTFCKGLGSYTKKELSQIILDRKKYFFNPEFNEDSLKLFDKIMGKNSITRKEMYNMGEDIDLEEEETTNVKDFMNDLDNISMNNYLNKKYKEFLFASNLRCLPAIEDSFNPSTRKIISVLLHLGDKKTKIIELASNVISKYKYHHGDVSLVKTIMKNSVAYPTGLNIPLLLIHGNGGSRNKSCDYASPRYISGFLNPLMTYIIRKEDECILEYQYEEGIRVEPKYYYPIIPMILVNTSDYVGTGFNCYIPSFDPIVLVHILKNILNNSNDDNTISSDIFNNIDFHPYSRGFTGKIRLVKKEGIKLYSISEGVFSIEKNKKNQEYLHITEIPHNITREKFHLSLEKNGIVYERDAHNDTINKPSLIVTDLSLKSKVEKCLTSIKGLNLNIFKNSELTSYNNLIDILLDYIKIRYNAYISRKNKIIEIMNIEFIEKLIMYYLYKYIINDFPDTIQKQNKVIDSIWKIIKPKINNTLDDETLYAKIKHLLNGIRVVSVTKINLEKEFNNLKLYQDKLRKYSKTSVEDIWNEELNEFLVHYQRMDLSDYS